MFLRNLSLESQVAGLLGRELQAAVAACPEGSAKPELALCSPSPWEQSPEHLTLATCVAGRAGRTARVAAFSEGLAKMELAT